MSKAGLRSQQALESSIWDLGGHVCIIELADTLHPLLDSVQFSCGKGQGRIAKHLDGCPLVLAGQTG